MKRILLVLLGVLVLIGAAIVLAKHHHNSSNIPKPITFSTSTAQKPTLPSLSTLSSTIQNDDNPNSITYSVTSRSEPVTGWFVVSVVASNNYGTFGQIAALRQSSNGDLDVVAGPDTSFPLSYLKSIGVPQQVIDTLPTYTE